jgi:hypothetical protein
MLSKADLRRIQRYHAMKRCRERYDIRLDDFDYQAITRRVFDFITGRPTFGVDSGVGAAFFVTFAGVTMIAQWDETTMQIATFHPRARPLSDYRQPATNQNQETVSA